MVYEDRKPLSVAVYSENGEALTLFGGLFDNHFNSLGDDLCMPKALIALTQQRVDAKMRSEYFATTYEAACRAADLREQRVNAYFSVAPVKAAPHGKESRKQTAISQLLTLHLDVDHYSRSAARSIKQAQPSAMVYSGHGLHAYWFLDEPAPITQKLLIRSLNRELVQQFGGDFNATDVGRILRIPGTFNVKNPNNPKRVELIECDPNTRYPLGYLIERFGSKILSPPSETVKLSFSETAPRGRFLGSDERVYVDRLLREGLFEPQSRNTAILLLSRYCLEQGMPKDEANRFITDFFEGNHNNLSRDWLADREGCVRHIRAAIDDCWKKAPNWQQSYRGRGVTATPRKLSRSDLDYIESLQLGKNDKQFLTDALTFIMNYQRDGVIILEHRQIIQFSNTHSRNYKKKLALLESLEIIKLKAKHRKASRLATEFYILYKFREGAEGEKRGNAKQMDSSAEIACERQPLAA